MKLNQLEIFCKILEQGSFSKAAEIMHLSQPTLTEHIKALEDYFEIPLLNRLGREVVPTKAGEILHDYAQKILHLKDETKKKLKGFKGDFKGELVVGASTIPGEFILPRLIKKFRDQCAGIFIHLKISDTKEVINEIVNNKIELGVVGAKVEKQKLEYHRFVKDELILVVPPEFSLSKTKSISLTDLTKIPFVLREEGSGTRMVLEKTLKERGLNFSQLNVVSILGSTTAVLQAIKNGMGGSILSRRAVQEDLSQGTLKAITIQNVKIPRDFYLVVRRGKTKSPLCDAFFGFLLDTKR